MRRDSGGRRLGAGRRGLGPDGRSRRGRGTAVCGLGLELALDRRWRRLIGAAGVRGLDDARAGEGARLGRSGDRRRAVVGGGAQRRRGRSGLDVVGLQRRGRNVRRPRGGQLCGGRACGHAARPVEAGGRPAIHHDRLLVDIGEVRIADVVDAAVVEEVVVPPVTALIGVAVIAEAVVDAAVVADLRPPVAFVEAVGAVLETPPRRGPQQAGLRRLGPGARHPVVVVDVRVPGPIARGPDVVRTGDRRLVVDWQRRRRESDADVEGNLRLGDCRRNDHGDGRGQYDGDRGTA